jgi:VWFA-related protein
MALVLAFLAVAGIAAAADSTAGELRADSQMVLIHATVVNTDGRVVTGLDPDRFEVRDERTPVALTHVVLEDAPVSTVVLVDVSHSMRFGHSRLMAALQRFLESRGTGDDFCVLPFAEHVEGTCEFSSSPGAAVAELQARQPAGETALLDAMGAAFLAAKQAPNQRRAVLLLSDSVDNASRTTWTQARTLAQEFDGTLYAIAPPLYDADNIGDEKRLQDLAETTGGRMFRLRGLNDLGPTLDSLDLRHRYVLSYGVGPGARDGRYHRVSVKLRNAGPLRVYWRRGYVAPGEIQ